jgi:anti-anti-sigma factor
VTSLSIEPHLVNDGVLRLAIAGEVDLSTCELLGATIRAVVAAGHVAELVVDLDRVTFHDSTGIAVLVDGHNFAVAHGVAYLVINPNNMVHDVLSITGVLPVLTEEP